MMQEKDGFLIRSEDIPVLEYGKYPGARTAEELIKNGLVVLDKWRGPTSHDVTATVRRLFSLKRAGHSGTLDPAVSGVLLVTLENACKLIPALQGLDKEYVGVVHLHKDVDDKKLQEAVKKFIGEIRQTPPVRSAVARRERTRRVYSFELLDRDGRDAAFRIVTEAGTYIRTICHQLGKEIGGAHMSELRRVRVGRFGERALVRMDELALAYADWKDSGDERIKDCILPLEAAVEHVAKIIIKDSAVHSIASGSPLYSGGVCRVQKGIAPGQLVALHTLKGELVALAKAAMTSEDMARRKGIAAKTSRVIMEKGAYPRFRKE